MRYLLQNTARNNTPMEAVMSPHLRASNWFIIRYKHCVIYRKKKSILTPHEFGQSTLLYNGIQPHKLHRNNRTSEHHHCRSNITCSSPTFVTIPHKLNTFCVDTTILHFSPSSLLIPLIRINLLASGYQSAM
jgi:hypothetical protein